MDIERCGRCQNGMLPPTVYTVRKHACGCVEKACLNCKAAWKDVRDCRHRNTTAAMMELDELARSLERQER